METEAQLRQMFSQLTDEELTAISPLTEEMARRNWHSMPTDRQLHFLNLTCEEALFGGAAGGAKTWALCLWLAEGIHLSDYSAIIFRRTYKQLTVGNDALVPLTQRLYPRLGGTYHKSEKKWVFESGAVIQMGHLQHEEDVNDYQGPSFHRVAFDELTHFTESQYLYMFSRMRKAPNYPIYLGIRSASNPGSIGHQWVKKRFITRQAIDDVRNLSYEEPSRPDMVYWSGEDTAFVPSRVADNHHLDVKDYIERMDKWLPPLLKERLLAGD